MPTNPKITTATQETNSQDFDFDLDFDFEMTHSHPESSSGVRFDAGNSSDAGFSEHDEAAMRYAPEKRKFIEQNDSDEDVDINVARLQRRVIRLEQDVALKEAQISSLFGNEFIVKEDEQFNIGHPEQTTEERAAARVATDAEHEARLNAYLAVEPKKKRKKPEKNQSNKQMPAMKNQDMNPLDENFQLKDPMKRPS
ncbi:hypothetical protein Hanom_Chr12g01159061 [Helianthus anomalus]